MLNRVVHVSHLSGIASPIPHQVEKALAILAPSPSEFQNAGAHAMKPKSNPKVARTVLSSSSREAVITLMTLSSEAWHSLAVYVCWNQLDILTSHNPYTVRG